MALSSAEKYRIENGLSIDKLRTLIFDISDNIAMFLAPGEIKPNGLANDMACQLKPVPEIEDQNGRLNIRQTEHTRPYITM